MKFRNFSRLFDSQFQRQEVNKMLLSRPMFHYENLENLYLNMCNPF